MRAAILDGTLWLGIPAGGLARADAQHRPPHAPRYIEHLIDLGELQRVAAAYGDNVPALLKRTLNIDLRRQWRELTEPDVWPN